MRITGQGYRALHAMVWVVKNQSIQCLRKGTRTMKKIVSILLPLVFSSALLAAESVISVASKYSLKERHDLRGCDQVVTKISKVLGELSAAATSR
jgi:hypothetical protein